MITVTETENGAVISAQNSREELWKKICRSLDLRSLAQECNPFYAAMAPALWMQLAFVLIEPLLSKHTSDVTAEQKCQPKV